MRNPAHAVLDQCPESADGLSSSDHNPWGSGQRSVRHLNAQIFRSYVYHGFWPTGRVSA